MERQPLNPDHIAQKERLAFLDDNKSLKRAAFYYIVTAQVIGMVGVVWFFLTF